MRFALEARNRSFLSTLFSRAHSCFKVGLKLFARDFDLSGSILAPFAPSDVADCAPVSKPAPLHSKDVRVLLDHGKMFLRANSLPHAFECFRHAQERAVQTCGVLHADNAEAFAYLAKVAHKFGENAQAVQFLQSSLSIR
jgi:tetratricopeptide (TPR) repeat protein